MGDSGASMLAAWAIVCAAARYYVALDRRAAARAWRSRLAEDAEFVLIAAQAAPGGAIVAERGASAPDGAPQRMDDGRVQRRHLVGRQRLQRAARVQTRAKQRFVDVD